LERGIAVRQGRLYLRMALPQILAAPARASGRPSVRSEQIPRRPYLGALDVADIDRRIADRRTSATLPLGSAPCAVRPTRPRCVGPQIGTPGTTVGFRADVSPSMVRRICGKRF
jgi:hypothetical protein